MCAISQLITRRRDPRCHLPPLARTSHNVFFLPRLRHLGLASGSVAKVSWRKRYRCTTRFMRDSHSPFFPCLQNTSTPTRGAASVPGGLRKQGPIYRVSREQTPSSPSPVTGANWEPKAGLIQSKPRSRSLAFSYRTGIDNLGHRHKDKNHQMTECHRWSTHTHAQYPNF